MTSVMSEKGRGLLLKVNSSKYNERNMTTDIFVRLLAERSGFSEWDILKMLDGLGELVQEEAYTKGEIIAIGGLGEFKQVTVCGGKDSEFKVLSFKPVPSMNNNSWIEWYKY